MRFIDDDGNLLGTNRVSAEKKIISIVFLSLVYFPSTLINLCVSALHALDGLSDLSPGRLGTCLDLASSFHFVDQNYLSRNLALSSKTLCGSMKSIP